MAYVEERKRADGSVSYVVRWRAGGARTGKKESEVFTEEPSASQFRDLVNAHGQRWPFGWVRGEGFRTETAREIPQEESFGAFAEHYIGLLTGIQDDTRGKYRRQIEQKMLPWFQHLSVREGEGGIGRDDVAGWVNDLEAGRRGPYAARGQRFQKLKPKTIRNLHGLLYSVLQSAVDAEQPLRSANPCAATRLPRVDGSDEEAMTFLERDEFVLLYACLYGEARDLAEVLAGTGARLGEVTALQPRDLIRRGGRPAVRIQRAWKTDEDGNVYLGPPKTKKSRRTLVLTPELDALLRRLAQGKEPNELLFSLGVGKNGAESFRRNHWRPAVKDAARRGLLKRPRIHDLRHSHASWLIAAKVPLPAIQARLGHESIKTTVDRYGHLLDSLDDEVVAAVAWAMEPVTGLPQDGFSAAA
ncbi:tyrosine-type recombinase/integrase [Streptomyces sp. NPDC048172]|uniref:tyrosine-type recombinase/integrase n=1 Tax=Streptomyces sp. NPDC048172 TaxID=3365505 RepID=UPI003717E866